MSLLEPENTPAMETDGPLSTCHTCRRVLRKTTQGEVRYNKVWLCLPCHVMERELKSIKGKGTVERILQQCDGQCSEASAVARDCKPVWFCYDCCQYLCDPCATMEHKQHVRLLKCRIVHSYNHAQILHLSAV